jgi:hypothetical protein
MAGCDILYYDPAHVDRDPASQPLGPASGGWRPCTAPGQAWTDPDLVLRWICPRHRRQLVALHAADLAGQVRWQRPGLATGPASSSQEQA